MGLSIPKQYYIVKGIPIILYSIRRFAYSGLIDKIVIVLSEEWRHFIEVWLSKEHLNCEVLFAQAGCSRQHSVLSGLEVLNQFAAEDDLVLVHDAVRPLFPSSNIIDGIDACSQYDGALPVIRVKDATYQSRDGERLTSLLPRQELFSGQSPECFIFGKLLKAHALFANDEIMSIRGCAELAFKAGLSVRFIPGTENNYKLTTIEDLRAFELSVE